MLATVLLDIVFVPLLLTGIETLQPVAGTHGTYGANVIHADYTHSLVGAVALSVAFGIACGSRRKLRSGVVLGLVSFSHWLLASHGVVAGMSPVSANHRLRSPCQSGPPSLTTGC
jgi:hypothetical protein